MDRADVGGDLSAEVADAERAAHEHTQERTDENYQHVDLTSPCRPAALTCDADLDRVARIIGIELDEPERPPS
jgi:uncharacterized protein YprB with RNaseH-like and TPR domain